MAMEKVKSQTKRFSKSFLGKETFPELSSILVKAFGESCFRYHIDPLLAVATILKKDQKINFERAHFEFVSVVRDLLQIPRFI